MLGELFYIGITHDTAPLAVRERARPDADKQLAMLDRLSRLSAGRMILTTCERFEIYAHRTAADDRAWMNALADWFHLPAWVLADHAKTARGAIVAEHLLRVAAGLESRILGEAPILGQVRASFEQANIARTLNAELSAVGRAAIRSGKRVRHETAIGDGARSIATLAVDRIAAERGSIRHLDVVVLGSGQLSSEVVADLALRRSRRVTIVARNAERGAALGRRFAAEFRPFPALAEAIRAADAVVACTSAGSFVLDASAVGASRSAQLTLIDLCVPRNIDPTLALLRFVQLTGLDDISCSQATRGDALSAANRIVQEELAGLADWLRVRRIAPRIAELIRQAEQRKARGEAVDAGALHRRIARLKVETAA